MASKAWRPVRTISARRAWTDYPDTEHYTSVKQEYGAFQNREYGVALCGRKGVLMPSYPSSPKCKICTKLLEAT